MTTSEFLHYLHGKTSIYFHVGGKTWRNKPRPFDAKTDKLLRHRNEQGDDICFIVNSGGTRNDEITRINAVFIDWDCGRDADGKYFDEGTVKEKKAVFQKYLCKFRPIPSAVVETRNGVHVYWFLESVVTNDQFRDAQKRLADHFGSDERVCNPARVMRLPGYDWIKPQSGLPRFPVDIIAGTGERYTLEQVLSQVEVVPESTGSSVSRDKTSKQSSTSVDGRISAHNNTGVNNTPVIVGSYPATPLAKDINDLKTNIDLAQWLSNQTKKLVSTGPTLCPFHPDKKPSAGVYRAKDNTWLFRCHSCGVGGSIIDLAMRIWRCDAGTAIKHLVGTGGHPVDPEKCQLLKDLLDRNIKVINGLTKETNPGLWRLVGRVRADLISKLDIARTAVGKSGLDIGGQPLFFASLRWLSGAAKGIGEPADWPNRQNEKIDRYCLLGLLRKVRDDEIPPEILKQAREHQRDGEYRVQFYAVPEYTAEVIAEAEKRADNLKAGGCSVRGISYELIESVFGKQTAEAIYPQQAKGKTRPRSTFCAQVDETVCLLIKSKGYATTADIQNTLVSSHQYKSVMARRIEKCLPAVLAKHGLVRRICDGKLKAKLGLTAKGYPKVIVPK